ncbi:MAG: response regulator [Deltaproteobacteria bacterium]|nr:response regulator [Deltaproteobacteria bacterium]
MSTPVSSDSTFRFLVEHSPDGHFLIVDGVLEYLNPAGLEMFGRDAGELGTLHVSEVVHPSERERVVNNIRLRTSGVLRGATTFLAQHADGSTFPIEVHAVPAGVGGRDGLHGVIRNITNRRKMEERLARMERAGLVSRLSAGIAHDFNNLLAIMLTNTEVALREAETAPVREALKHIRSAGVRGSEKVRQIQTMGGTNRPTEEFRPLYVNPIVEEVLELTEPRWRDEAELKGITYGIDWTPGDAPPVAGSAQDLRNALIALVFNAIEAMPQGGDIVIRAVRTPANDALITVRDSGNGIAETDLERLVDPFFTTREDREMGLGLHLVEQVLTRHSGRLEVDSDPGVGTTIALVIPPSAEAPSEAPRAPREDLSSVSSFGAMIAPAPPGARSVLLIDDQADLVQVVETILRAQGWHVDAALNGRDGLAIAEQRSHSIVLTDLGMPDISGWEVAQRVGELQPDTPVILMTGWAAEIDESRLEDHGISALLPKPFRTEALLKLVERIANV